ncbi:MAG TPA: glycerophosphodiester phosphodiesterase [Syntrophobacteraceae bacterium]|nr:glycerophosphodiester phosphodiesterase [Syntrophobacteraceae bacterium]
MMPVPATIERHYQRLSDWLFARLPQSPPTSRQAQQCRIVAHRGQHDGVAVMENTVPAFDAARNAGVWGIELDVRWTRDLEPVVFHDPDCRRLFGEPTRLAELSWGEIQSRLPTIPSLLRVIERYGKQLHLMVCVKPEIYPNPTYQRDLLRDLLSTLSPQSDYHLLAIDTALFRHLTFAPRECFLPIADVNWRELSRQAITQRYAGIAGHYWLITQARIRQHQRYGQQTGTGFVSSRNCLFREIRRRVDWVFSNCAAKLQAICGELAEGTTRSSQA